MKFDVHLFGEGQDIVVDVVLARRNLLALLHKLDMADSARTLVSLNGPPGVVLVVSCEDDSEHYAGREEGPGALHPDSEQFVSEHGGLTVAGEDEPRPS